MKTENVAAVTTEFVDFQSSMAVYQAQVDAYIAKAEQHSYAQYAMTPEGKIKEKVKKLLKEYGDELYYHMPVQNGMGTPSLDFICCYRGHYFAIETKAPDKDLTERQRVTADEMQRAGGTVFRVRDQSDLSTLEMWLESRS